MASREGLSDEVIFEQRPEGSERMSCTTIWGGGFQVLGPACGWYVHAVARNQVTEAKGVRWLPELRLAEQQIRGVGEETQECLSR